MADCDFNQAALHPAYPIKCRTSTQKTQAPESVDTPKSLPPLTHRERNSRKPDVESNCLLYDFRWEPVSRVTDARHVFGLPGC
jgi:hypothetical protein